MSTENGEEIRFLFFYGAILKNFTISKINILRFELEIIEDGEEILFFLWDNSINQSIKIMN